MIQPDYLPNATTCRLLIQGRTLQIQHGELTYCLKYSHGWQYLCILLEYPGIPLHAWQLEAHQEYCLSTYQQYETATAIQSGELHYADLQPSLPLADLKTIKDIKHRLCFLIEAIATATGCNDLSAIDDLMEEKEALQDYLMQLYTPQGNIREFSSNYKQQLQRVLRAINRALEQLKPLDPALAEYLRQHLQLGYWLSCTPGELEFVLIRH